MKNCYRNSLRIAASNGCASIAFPLIATGVYGFPKDKALQIATSEIQKFLFENEMSVMLVVFDRKAFELSGKVFSEVQSFVDENYVKRSYHREYRGRHGKNEDFDLEEYELRYRELAIEEDYAEEAVLLEAAMPEPSSVFSDGIENMSLDEVIGNPGDSFQERLFKLIDRSGMDDVSMYKKANITKKVFSDIRSKKSYKPSKKTAVALIIALELPMDEAQDLLARAGFAFSPSSRFDLIVGYFISHGIYDIYTINEVLFANKQECLGTSLN